MENSHVDKLAYGLAAYRRNRYLSIAGLLALLAIIISVACSVGSENISLSQVWRVLISVIPGVNVDSGIPANIHTIVLNYRMPQILMAALVGAALSTAGATYQGLLRNPLADPYFIGVAQGAGLGGVIGFIMHFSGPAQLGSVPMLAFLGGMLSAAVLYALARVGKTLPVATLILAGVALGALLSSITSLLMINSDQDLHGILLWLMGGFGNSDWTRVLVLLPYMLIGLVPIYIYSRPLNLIQLDEEQAQQLGVNVEKVKLILLLSATVITAAAVSFSGTIGFVGIIIPHTIRLIWGSDYRFLLPLSTIVGAIFMILANIIARTVSGTAEVLPVGVVTALIGVPFFLYLLQQKKRSVFGGIS